MTPIRLTKPFLLVAIAAALIGLVSWTLRSASALHSSLTDSSSMDDRIERLITEQQAQGDRLARLESILAKDGIDDGLQNAPAMRNPHADRGEEEADRSPEAALLRQKALQDHAESVFKNETLSASWASSTEAMVDAAMAPKNLQLLQAPAPLSYSSECRTFTCKIQMTYGSDAQVDLAQQALLYGIAGKLPNAQWFQQVNSDGSVQLTAYAHSGGPGRH